MDLSFAKYFVDPICKSPLNLEIHEKIGNRVISGLFKNEKSEYPIIKGIPRFVSNFNYSNSFGFQWGKWPHIQFESENIGKPMQGHTSNMFNKITNNYFKNLYGSNLLLDIGCGSGRFIDLFRSMKDIKIIGIDYSNSVQMAYLNFKNDPNVCIVQADALNLPFKSKTFHGSFSIGVLHHTPSPKNGVDEAFRVLKNKGRYSVCVYAKGSYYDTKILKSYRKLFSFFRPLFSFWPAIIYAHFMVRVVSPLLNRLRFIKPLILEIFPYTDLPDKNWAVLDTFDSVTPTHASVHSSKELKGWMKNAGFKDITPTNWGPTSFIAKK
tara:strand:- start:6753 stop:7721 length:969 start_codon:yes stop_codon:yes gene_type:complete